MNGRTVVNSLGESVAKSMGEMSKLDWLITAGLVYSALKIGGAVVPLWNRFRERNIPSEADLTLINSEYDSALAMYEAAVEDVKVQAYGAAFNKISAALKELNHTSGKRNQIQSLEIHKVLHAKLRYLLAEVNYYQGEFQSAERELLRVITLDQSHVLSHNLLAHLYIYHFHKPEHAKFYLKKSLELNPTQSFAKFYLAKLKNDAKQIDASAEEIIDIYQQQLQHGENSLATQRLAELQASTPALRVMIPFILLNWLQRKMAYADDQQSILNILNVFTATLNSQVFTNQQHVQIMLKEARVKAYMKIASLKKLQADFNDADQLERHALGLRLPANDGDRFFYQYDVSHLDRRVTKLFPHNIRTGYLLNPEHRLFMSQLIVGWAQEGWFIGDENPLIKALVENLLLFKHNENNAELNDEIHNLAASDQLVAHFIKQYIDGKGWAPWFKAVKGVAPNSIFTLISLACQHQGVSMHIYGKDAVDSKAIHETEALVVNERGLHVLYNPAESTLSILDELTSPSRVYRWIAIKANWELLHEDPTNERALELAGMKGFTALPDICRESLANESLPKSATAAMANGLGLFISGHKGEYKGDKAAAEELQSKLHEKLHPTFFTRSRVASAVGGAALIGLGAYLLRNR